MEALVAFFDRLVTEFSWRRVGLLFAILIFGILSIWAYESLTGHFWSIRMQFATEQLTQLSDPDLKKNIEGDQELEQVHANLKSELNQFLEETNYDFGVPEPILKAVAAALPWILLGILLTFITERGQGAQTLVGMFMVSIPFIVIGALIPNFAYWWINYAVYPLGSMVLVIVAVLTWQRGREGNT